MMKENIFSLFIITSLFILGGCSSNRIPIEKHNQDNIGEQVKESVDAKMSNDELETKIYVTIDEKKYTMILEDNNTTRELFNDLPLNLYMKELNGNEKYIYLNNKYPTNSSNPKHINKGDVMLYEDDCLVIFYKSFDTSYNYTKIGYIENLADLGNGNITAKFEKNEKKK